MDKVEAIRTYMKQWVDGAEFLKKGHSVQTVHEYVLRKGVGYPSTILTNDEFLALREVIDRGTWSLEMKHCFANAQRLVMLDCTEFEYAEGFALDNSIPLHHAWAVWRGHPIDVTWGITSGYDANRKHKIMQRIMGNMLRNGYFGVPIESHRISRMWMKERAAHSVLEDLIREEIEAARKAGDAELLRDPAGPRRKPG